jgi:hypothetical protein
LAARAGLAAGLRRAVALTAMALLLVRGLAVVSSVLMSHLLLDETFLCTAVELAVTLAVPLSAATIGIHLKGGSAGSAAGCQVVADCMRAAMV